MWSCRKGRTRPPDGPLNTGFTCSSLFYCWILIIHFVECTSVCLIHVQLNCNIFLRQSSGLSIFRFNLLKQSLSCPTTRQQNHVAAVKIEPASLLCGGSSPGWSESHGGRPAVGSGVQTSGQERRSCDRYKNAQKRQNVHKKKIIFLPKIFHKLNNQITTLP